MSHLVRTFCAAVAIFSAEVAMSQTVTQNSPPSRTQNIAIEPHLQVELWRIRSMSRNPYGERRFAANELKLLTVFEKQIEKADADAARQAMVRAAAGISSRDGRYVLGALELRYADKTNDDALRYSATNRILGSGMVPAGMLGPLYRNQGVMAVQRGDKANAEAAFTHIVAANPSDAESAVILGQLKVDAGKPAEALALFDQAVRVKQAANQAVPPVWIAVANQVRAKVGGGIAR